MDALDAALGKAVEEPVGGADGATPQAASKAATAVAKPPQSQWRLGWADDGVKACFSVMVRAYPDLQRRKSGKTCACHGDDFQQKR